MLLRFTFMLTAVLVCVSCRAPQVRQADSSSANTTASSTRPSIFLPTLPMELQKPTDAQVDALLARRPLALAILYLGIVSPQDQDLFDRLAAHQAFGQVRVAAQEPDMPAATQPALRAGLELAPVLSDESLQRLEAILQSEKARGTDYCMVVTRHELASLLRYSDASIRAYMPRETVTLMLMDMRTEMLVWMCVPISSDPGAAVDVALDKFLQTFRISLVDD